MNVTEAIHTQVLLAWLVRGDSEAERDAAQDSAGFLAERAWKALGAGPDRAAYEAAFAAVFPRGLWELPPPAAAEDDPELRDGRDAGDALGVDGLGDPR